MPLHTRTTMSDDDVPCPTDRSGPCHRQTWWVVGLLHAWNGVVGRWACCLPYLGCALGWRPLRCASDSLCDCGLCGSGSTACAWMWMCACQWRVREWGRSARCDIQGVCRGVSNPAMRARPWFVMGRGGCW